MRIAYVEALLRAGRDVLLSDIDAFWVRNSLPYLQHVAEATRADITASRDGGGRPVHSLPAERGRPRGDVSDRMIPPCPNEPAFSVSGSLPICMNELGRKAPRTASFESWTCLSEVEAHCFIGTGSCIVQTSCLF